VGVLLHAPPIPVALPEDMDRFCVAKPSCTAQPPHRLGIIFGDGNAVVMENSDVVLGFSKASSSSNQVVLIRAATIRARAQTVIVSSAEPDVRLKLA